MARGTRLGNFSKTVAPKNVLREVKANSLTVVSQQGKNRPLERELPLDNYHNVPLIANYLPEIRRVAARRKTPGSIKALKADLRDLGAYSAYYTELYGNEITTNSEVEISFTYSAVDFFENQGGRVHRLRNFNRLMIAIGIDRKLLATVPWDDDPPPPKEVLSDEAVRKALRLAKKDVRVVINRLEECQTLNAIGFDPRRESGGKMGDWSKPECRYWIMKNVFRFEARLFDELRFRMNLNSELRGFEKRPGAEFVELDGTIQRHEGWLGHQRWTFPFATDLIPFFTIILLRSSVNAAALSIVNVRERWAVPCPVRLGANRTEDFVYILCQKVRGRRIASGRPKVIRFMSEATHWDHPYQLMKFVEKWTKPLRNEIYRRIKEIKAIEMITPAQAKELARLIEIKDDLFIYKTEQQISSFAEDMSKGTVGRAFPVTLKRYGLPNSLRYLRDVGLAHSQGTSGGNLLVLRIIANHSNISTAAAYARRKQLIERAEERSKASFDNSLKLIREKRFSKDALRKELTDQGFNSAEVSNLMNPGNETRYGNRCANPEAPPKGFDFGTAPGDACRHQDCIDGCPHARWFRQSLPTLILQLRQMEQEFAQARLESRLLGTLEVRIDRVRARISYWSQEDIDKATQHLDRGVAA
ncbi:hypothetical protein BMW22_04395 [Rhizobium leguminosarum]|uniref:Integrase n=1 Tax=Rhizobium leguminosarum TaxID=384 RepID=A0A1L3Z5M9_RHILE|nr:hypothetical protein [Rhizobium leguminosarum]API50983.1 hypothetical protein BMW22_04395 [Rhizobium leguminosarum]